MTVLYSILPHCVFFLWKIIWRKYILYGTCFAYVYDDNNKISLKLIFWCHLNLKNHIKTSKPLIIFVIKSPCRYNNINVKQCRSNHKNQNITEPNDMVTVYTNSKIPNVGNIKISKMYQFKNTQNKILFVIQTSVSSYLKLLTIPWFGKKTGYVIPRIKQMLLQIKRECRSFDRSNMLNKKHCTRYYANSFQVVFYNCLAGAQPLTEQGIKTT